MIGFWEQTLRLMTLSDANVRFVILGMVLLGTTGGVLGSLTMLRKRALIGDALAHAALPGIGIAFLLTGVKSTWVLLLGAYGAGVLGVLALLAIRRYSHIKEDSALAIILTVFFGIGIVILTYIQKSGLGGQSGLDKFLFGQSASLIAGDVRLIAIVTVILLILTALFLKEFKLLCFNSEYAGSIGFSAVLLDVLLMSMAVGAVVIGLQAVGVVLMSALLIIPPVTARLWTDKFGTMIITAGIIGGLTGIVGSYLSFLAPRMPSGPLTVLASTAIFVISLLIAPRRGMITRIWQRLSLARRTKRENGLRAIAELAEEANFTIEQPFDANQLVQVKEWSRAEITSHMNALIRSRHLQKEGGQYRLTHDGGILAEELLRRHRLWELYLMHQADIPADHVHRDADESEHFLSPELEARLIKLVGEEADTLPSPHPLTKVEAANA